MEKVKRMKWQQKQMNYEREEKDVSNEEYSIQKPKIKRSITSGQVIVLAVILLLVFGIGVKYARYLDGSSASATVENSSITATSDWQKPAASSDVVVQVTGAAGKTGYFSVAKDVSLRELLEYVGVRADGDVSDFDLTHKLMQGDVFYIKDKHNPVDGTLWLENHSEEALQEASEAAQSANPNLININTATLEELDALPGIGPSKAQAIIDYRQKYGKFTRKEDLMGVSGIGEKTYAELKDLITF